ncbi:MAG: choice-of-anchor D domain-containing protein, partial [Myxococcota bacterium]
MSRIMRVSFSVLCFALPFAACECGDDLSAIPQPSAQLRAGEQLAPPLEFVQVAFGAVDVGQGVEQTLAIESIGGAPLTIEQVRLASDTNLCPVVGSGFSVLEPTAGFEIPPRRGEEASPPGRDVVVRFIPTDGAPACAVLEVLSDDEKNPVLRALLTGQGDAPRLCTETPSIDFGEVFLGATAEKTLVLESCGTKPAVISTISGNQWFPPFGVGDGAAGATLVPGERLSLTVTFSPTEERRWSYATNNAGVVTIATSDGSGQGYQVGLEGTGVREPACRLLVVPGAVAFGTVAEEQTSTQQVVLRNSGELDCSLAGVTVRNPSGPFSSTLVDTSVPTTMSPGAVVIIDVTYAPTVAAGADNGFLDISSNDPVAPTLSVPLEGISVEPTPCMLQAAPSAVNFGNRPMGRTSEVAVVFTNVGTEQCSLTKLELTTGAPQFDVVASLFPLTGSPISPGGSMTAQVTYRPNTQGAAAGNLRATYKEGFSFNLPFPLPGGSSDQTLDVPLLGQGVPPALCVSPAALDFGSVAVGASRQEPVQVINCGSTPLEVRGLQLRAATHPDFSIANAPALPLTLDAGAGFPVTVRAAPTQGGISAAGSGMYGALEVLSDDFDDPAVAVPLTANSSGCQGLVCSPQEVDFGEVDVGLSLVRSVTCQNPSSTPVSVNPSTLAPFEVLSGPEVVAPGAVVVLTVRYTPDAAGADGGWLEMGAQACNGTALRVDLQGAGVTNALPECPTPQSFTPEVVWNWQGGSTLPMSRQTWVTPLVSRLQDTTGDGLVTREDMPRVIFSSFDHRDSPGLADFDHINDPVPGVIRAVDGATGVEVFTIIDEEHRVNSSVNLVVADIDADGYVEIVGQRYVLLEGVETIENGPKINGKFVRGNLIAFEHDGTFKWVSEEWTRSESEIEDTGAIAVADIDGDGFGELAVGDHVFDHNGN